MKKITLLLLYSCLLLGYVKMYTASDPSMLIDDRYPDGHEKKLKYGYCE